MDNLEQLKEENEKLRRKLTHKESFWGSMDNFWGPLGFFMAICAILMYVFGVEL